MYTYVRQLKTEIVKSALQIIVRFHHFNSCKNPREQTGENVIQNKMEVGGRVQSE